MKCGLLTVDRQTTLTEAADILSSKGVTGLPVVDEGMHLQGIVSEKDILKRLFEPNATSGLVSDIMTENVTSFSHTDSLYDVCTCLIDHEFRRVPILNKGRLVGIITRADIVMFILKNSTAISRGMVCC
jgi:CBS domain-containing protein